MFSCGVLKATLIPHPKASLQENAFCSSKRAETRRAVRCAPHSSAADDSLRQPTHLALQALVERLLLHKRLNMLFHNHQGSHPVCANERIESEHTPAQACENTLVPHGSYLPTNCILCNSNLILCLMGRFTVGAHIFIYHSSC